ncbi:MAG TPA: A/G-specific adenine glycosylase [Terracidiphilus sp.]|jgi:A/G-specific adenine glycosylase|nr:A/G-specific adenine glycosylase [Terracidiphilus sp.]
MGPKNPPRLRERLLRWYEGNRRDLPWRHSSDPYAIWVSEIMLQQTRVAAVEQRYRAFMARFPTVAALARAGEQEVLALWSGLGYYRRARMLHQAARHVVEDHGGVLPQTAIELRKLPGIGIYTAAAIASIAHGEAVAVVDGNVERVLCRLAGWNASDAAGKSGLSKRVADLAARLVDPGRPGDFNQAMMELGATVCLPRNPKCLLCPIAGACVTRGEHKTIRGARIEVRDAAYALCLRNAATRTPAVLLQQRPASATVMPGLFELPALHEYDFPSEELAMAVRHAIMRVNYRVRIRRIAEPEVGALTPKGGRRRWVPVADLPRIALTGLARKVLTRANLMPGPTESHPVAGQASL